MRPYSCFALAVLALVVSTVANGKPASSVEIDAWLADNCDGSPTQQQQFEVGTCYDNGFGESSIYYCDIQGDNIKITQASAADVKLPHYISSRTRHHCWKLIAISSPVLCDAVGFQRYRMSDVIRNC